MIALDPATGREKWKFKMTDVTDSGILTTGSDLLFTGGREGYFQALDARTGALLWKTNLGAAINSGPITYRVGNRQYVDRVRPLAVRVRARRIAPRLGTDPSFRHSGERHGADSAGVCQRR